MYMYVISSLPLFSVFTDADFGSSVEITVTSGRTACTDFTDLVVDDDIALEGNEAFTIVVESSMAMVVIIDDDGEQISTDVMHRDKGPYVYVSYNAHSTVKHVSIINPSWI